MICEFCKKELSSLSSLNFHKKTAKYCIKIQKETVININDSFKFKCCICSKECTTKNNLISHLNNNCGKDLYQLNTLICEKDTIIDDLKKELDFLKENNIDLKQKNNFLSKINEIYETDHKCVQDIAKQPKNIVNSNTNNKILNIVKPLDFTSKETIRNTINDNYKLDYIFSGQKGIAKFAVDHFLKDDEGNLKYVCTDPSRQIFKYKDESGEVRKDIEAKKLTNFLVEGGIKHKACNMMNEWWTEETGMTNVDKFELLVDKAESLKIIDSDNTEFKKELATMTTI